MKYLNHKADLRCTHGGKVKPKSAPTRTLQIDDSPVLCAEDLLGAPIADCPQSGPGLKPCATVTTILMGRALSISSDNFTPLLDTLLARTDGSLPGIVQALSPGGVSMITLAATGADASNSASNAVAAAHAASAAAMAAATKKMDPPENTVLHWYELWLKHQDATVGGAAMNAERVFFLPEFDSTIPIREGFTSATDWVGYHAGKHGIFERFQNAKGEMVNMSQLFFGEEYRWIRPEYRISSHKLKPLTEALCNELAGKFSQNPKAEIRNLQGLIDSAKFTEDLGTIMQQYLHDPKSTVWQGRYAKGEGATLQTNIDFEAHGYRWRLALDPATNRAINFFRIRPELSPQRYFEIVVRWLGKATDAEVHAVPGSTFQVEISATWSGILRQGMQAGATTGAMVSSFLGGIDGFRQGGIPGALRGLAVGALSGAVLGAGLGALQTLIIRILPWLETALNVVGLIATFAAVLLDSQSTGHDPQEFAERYTDDAGNHWALRNIRREGTAFFPNTGRAACR